MRALAIALLIAGCDAQKVTVEEAALDTGGGSTAISFAALGGGSDDVVVVSPMRGEVDVISHDGGWSLFGSFYAGGVPVEAVGARVGGQPALLVRDDQGSVALLSSQTPHRLEFPVQVYRRVRNGQPVDDTPQAIAIAAADIDGDGDDELLVASSLGVVVVRGLAALVSANPERPPPANGWKLSAGAQPSAIAAADLDGDGRPDLMALDGDTLFVFQNRALGVFAHSQVTLPSAGRALVTTPCGALAVLVDGRVVDVSAKPVLREVVPVEKMAAGKQLLAVRSKVSSALALFDACGHSGAPFGPRADSLTDLTVGPQNFFATLDGDGRSLRIYAVGE